MNETTTYDLLYAPPGTKVRYLDENGYDSDKVNAKHLGLVKGCLYTLVKINIGSFCSNIYLQEFPQYPFNSVMFESMPYEEEYTVWMNEFESSYSRRSVTEYYHEYKNQLTEKEKS